MSQDQYEATWRLVQQKFEALTSIERDELAELLRNPVLIKALGLVHGSVLDMGQNMLNIHFASQDPAKSAMIAYGVQSQARGLTQALDTLIKLAFVEPKDERRGTANSTDDGSSDDRGAERYRSDGPGSVL